MYFGKEWHVHHSPRTLGTYITTFFELYQKQQNKWLFIFFLKI